jgi:hypothetical protein
MHRKASPPSAAIQITLACQKSDLSCLFILLEYFVSSRGLDTKA